MTTGWLVIVASVVLTSLGMVRLHHIPPYPLDFRAALAGAMETAATTVPVALRTWTVLMLVLGTLVRWLRRQAPDLSFGEATAGAVALFWAAAYVLMLALGPLGLFRPTVLYGLVSAVLALLLWRSRPAPPERGPADAGVGLAVWVFVLSVGPLLLLQFGSPVPPFVDMLAHPSGPQKVVTFHFYDAYYNDAAGLWPRTRQVVGYDALFAMVALLAGASGPLTMTSLIVPSAALQVLGVYLVARQVRGSLAGGLASLFLLQTFVWRRTPDTRFEPLAFMLMACGLALVFAHRRSGTRVALGALALGVSVTINPLIGAVGMAVAAAGALVEWSDAGRNPLVILAALAAASVFALPQVCVGLNWVVPLAVLGTLAIAGAALLSLIALVNLPPARRALPYARFLVVLGVPLVALLKHAVRQSDPLLGDSWVDNQLLFVFGLGGLLWTAAETWRHPERWLAVAVPGLALGVGLVVHDLASPLRFVAGTDPAAVDLRSVASATVTKMAYYWTPYWLAISAGVWFAAMARRTTRLAVVVLALALVIYPLRSTSTPLQYETGYETAQLSLVETWGMALVPTVHGYHAGRPDRRWVLDDAWQDLAAFLRKEVQAGRIDYYTHVLHISPNVEEVGVALGTGISVDVISPRYDPQSIWTGTGRVRGLDALPAAFAAHPPYVIVQELPPQQFPQLTDYEEIVIAPARASRPSFRLYRRKNPW